ncbi:MAG: manganese efflux pump [Clostridia bacterium]|nr:manganese efflux pump [Clostridia bacterium]
MEIDLVFVLTAALLGVGLAMDAFSVSVADGLSEPNMKKNKMLAISVVFALFQAVMPLAGWFVVHSAVSAFKFFQPIIPYVALALLSFIGGKMLYEAIKCNNDGECETEKLTLSALLMQGVATSIDALSVGFTISDYSFLEALFCVLIIAAVTFVICLFGVSFGKRFGTYFADKSGILGGVILIGIGIFIFIKSFF